MFKSRRYGTIDAMNNKSSFLENDSLRNFQLQLDAKIQKKRMRSQQIQLQRSRKKQLPAIRELTKLKNNVSSLKQQIKQKNKEHEMELKLSALLAQRNALRNQSMLPQIYPNYHRKPHYPQSDEQEQPYVPQKPMKRYRPAYQRLKKIKRPKSQLVRIMKKAFRVVAYVEILKKLTKKIRQKRKQSFNKFWPQNFQKSIKGIGKWFEQSCQKFFTIMINKKDSQIYIEGDENGRILAQKKKAIKLLMKVLISCISNLVSSESFVQVCKILHLFCKHGSYCQNGVLTREQLEIVCVSDANNYLRMDRWLEKSQLISIFFIKIIIYNLLLQPWKYNPEKYNIKNQTLYNNFYYFSSVFYQLICEVQQSFIKQKRSSEMEVGNWSSSSYKFKCSGSLCHLNKPHEDDELISGLVPEEKIEEIFPVESWNQARSELEEIVNRMHVMVRKIHWEFINQVYSYKDVSKLK